MSTAFPTPENNQDKLKKGKRKERTEGDKKKSVWANTLFIVVAIALLLALVNGCEGPSDDESASETAAPASAEPSTEAAPTTTEIANLAEGVDPEMGPQEWYDQEVYRANNCASQNLAYGGIPMCAIRGVDTANGGTMLVGYIDQDEEGVQEHFAQEQRRDMMVEAFAERVGQAKYEGDPRVQHVTDVRIIASGGKGLGSGWQGETPVQ